MSCDCASRAKCFGLLTATGPFTTREIARVDILLETTPVGSVPQGDDGGPSYCSGLPMSNAPRR